MCVCAPKVIAPAARMSLRFRNVYGCYLSMINDASWDVPRKLNECKLVTSACIKCEAIYLDGGILGFSSPWAKINNLTYLLSYN